MYYLGLDLGQKRDHSAMVVVERIDHRRAFQGTEFAKLDVRYVERMPLGTPYPEVVERVRAIVRPGGFALTVDATGVGAPVVDMLRAARLGCDLMPVCDYGRGKRVCEWVCAQEGFDGRGAGAAGERTAKDRETERRRAADAGVEGCEDVGWRRGPGSAGRGRLSGARRSGDCAGTGLLAREDCCENDLEAEGVEERLAERALGLGLRLGGNPAASEERYEDVGEYDPVLRSHCRLV